MAYREVSRVEIAEVVRRWQSGNSQRQIATGTGLSRATVRRYIVAAMGAGLTRDGAAPSEDQLSRLAGLNLCTPRKVETPTEEVLAPWADQVYEWLTADRLQVTRIHELLAGRGCRVSYTSLRRFIQRRGWQRRSPATVRMGESAPGEVAEMDFGRLGLIEDPATGRRRVVWALIIVLTYSRHSFVWPTFSQKLVDVIEGGGCLGLLRGRSQVPGDRQLPRGSGWCRSAPSPSHARLPGVLPAPGLHLRPGAGAPSPGQAPRGAWSALRAGAVLQGRGVQGSVGHEVCGQAMVSGSGRTEDTLGTYFA